MLSRFASLGGRVNDPYAAYVSLLLNGDGTNGAQNNTFLDSSTNNATITRYGDATQGTFSPFGNSWSNYFDGTGDYLSIPATNFTGDFTIECWFMPTATKVGFHLIMAGNSTNGIGNCQICVTNSGEVTLALNNAGVTATSGANIKLGTWAHIAVVRKDTSVKIYVNGVSYSTATSTATAIFATIGQSVFPQDYSPCGYISNVRICTSAVYSSNFTPSTTPLTAISGTSLLTCQSNRFVDNSANNAAITVYGDTKVVKDSPFPEVYDKTVHGGSGYFDGNGDWITTPNVSAFDFSSSATNFTIEAWVYNAGGGAYRGIAGARVNATAHGWCLYINTDNTFYMASTIIGNGFANRQLNATVIPINTWAHVALVKTSTGYKGYVNGIAGTEIALTGGLDYVSSQPVIIGALGSGGEFPFSGYISNLRIVKGTAVYTANFTPSTTPLTAIANTSLLLKCDNAGIYDATGKNDLVTGGNAQISTSVKKFGTGSMYFDGNGDYLLSNTATPTLFAFGTGDFTIEMWIYPTSLAAEIILYDQRPITTNGYYPVIYMLSGQLRYFINGTDTITGSTLSTNTWYHVAICRSGTSTKMFLNGTQTGSTWTDSSIYLNGTNRPIIATHGYNPGQSSYTGYIDDLRITKGVARYTSNFTPPTAALTL